MTLQLEREPGWTCKVTIRISEKVNFPQWCVRCRRSGPVEIVKFENRQCCVSKREQM